MVDRDKIILMTKLAVKDKTHMKEDRVILSHYRNDYVFVNNFKTRTLVFFVTAGMWGGYLLWRIEHGLNLPTDSAQLLSEYIFPGAVFVGIWLVIYTLISTYIFRKRYKLAQSRGEEYNELSEELRELHMKKKGDINEEGSFADEAIIFKIL
ncbi:MAG: hypothetical protein ATN33_02010 [Epulopiscium sp. Nele67-Bin001]|nr:MAG: hypothetical protein BEN18_09030 [Epulopiscium sp. Nuni2H_MBin001]OON90930.1 MAG: hypothetical protein ATN33_02010 [Epulopiscium sp. Nele67-Bin001]